MGRSLEPWLLVALLAAGPAAAQSQGLVVRDGTLGSGPLEVGPGTDPLGNPATYLITPELGEQSGSNLFHSFARFGIGAGETATFTGPDPIDGPQSVSNVISRVTGGHESQIDGTLRSTIPGADLWLINPSGVVFGEGAKLEVPGSFHASTGDYLGFGEGSLERFYADGRSSSVLSTARPEAFGFLGEGPAGAISVTGATLASVRPGDGLELVGGDVTLTRAKLDAPGGAISIRGGQIVVEQGSKVLAENAGADPAGTITVAASESLLVDASLLSVSTHSAGDAGSIHVEGPAVTFQHGPGLHNIRNPQGPVPTEVGASAETTSSGAGGTIEIDAGSLTITEGAALSALTLGSDATGDAGTIRISAGSLDLSARSEISAGAWQSQGDAGAIQIDVGGELRLDGTEDYAFIWTTVVNDFWLPLTTDPSLPGTPGRIDITAGTVALVNAGSIQSSCYACTSQAENRPAGAATVRIVADRLVVEGSNPNHGSFVGAITQAEGDAGTIQVRADSILISTADPWNPGIYAGTFGVTLRDRLEAGNAGTIDIEAGSLVIAPGGFIAAETGPGTSGKAGTVTVRADSVRIGPDPDAAPSSPVNAPAFITVSSFGTGNGGTIKVEASRSILLTFEGGPRFALGAVLLGPNLGTPSLIAGIFSATVKGGDGGLIHLQAPDITVTDGAVVATSTIGGGAAGDVVLSGDRIYVRNGAFVDSTSLPLDGPGGDVGNITLEATELIEVVGSRVGEDKDGVPWEDPSRVASASLGTGEGGTVELRAPRILIDGGAVATTALPSYYGWQDGSGGTITVNAGELIVRGGGRIDASSFVPGPGGNIDITASDSIVVEGKAADGIASGISSRTGAGGDGGAVTLRAPVIEVSEGGDVSAKSEADPALDEEVGRIFSSVIDDPFRIGTPPTEATGDAGSVTLAAEKVKLVGGTIATNAEAADGGSITIEAKQLVHLDAGVITAAVRDGAGGNITIDPEVVILQNRSRIVADAGAGSGGNIQITADNYFAFPGSVVDASSELGIDGIVEVSTPDVDLAGTLTALPASYLDAASLMKEPCAARRSGERAGSFAVRGKGGIPAEPDGWLPGTVSFDAAPGYSATSDLPAAPGGVPLVALGSCR